MRFVITGATGVIGRNLTRLLLERDENLLLVGRNEAKISRIFPDCAVIEYSALEENLTASDIVIHLAVVNNRTDVSLNEFRRGNIDLLQKVLNHSAEANVISFVYTSSSRVTREKVDTYTQSKKDAEALVHSYASEINVSVVRLSAVFGEGCNGKLRFLNLFPFVVATPIGMILERLKLGVSIDSALKLILSNIRTH